MACPTWGSGILWGDGTLWCREFGSNPYIADGDVTGHRISTKVMYSGSGSFVIDSIRPNIDWGRSQQSYTYEAWIDIDTAARISTQILYSSNGSFQINYITPHLRVKKHQPVG